MTTPTTTGIFGRLWPKQRRRALPLTRMVTSFDSKPWLWRPDLWTTQSTVPGLSGADSGSKLGAQTALFHDCPLRQITLRQSPAPVPDAPVPYQLALDVQRFDGSYLSLALDLPENLARSLTGSHILTLGADLVAEHPMAIFARINLQSGPNVEKIVLDLPGGAGPHRLAFDLAHVPMSPGGVTKAWLDLIFDSPAFNQVVLRDLSVRRTPRAVF